MNFSLNTRCVALTLSSKWGGIIKNAFRPLPTDFLSRHPNHLFGVQANNFSGAHRSCNLHSSAKYLHQTPTSNADVSIEDVVPTSASDCYYFHPACSEETVGAVGKAFQVVLDFVSKDEESKVLAHVEPHLKRMKYEHDHWDGAIERYRETELSRWPFSCFSVLERLKNYAFPPSDRVLVLTHVLDLAAEGCIKPHVDSVRFCGNIIAGLSLGSQSIMRLVKENKTEEVVDVLLPRRSLYIMRDSARYDFTHEILSNKIQPNHKGRNVTRSRRISVICRNEPKL